MSIFNYVGPPDFAIGGSETGTFRLCKELVKRGVEVVVCHHASKPMDREWKGQELVQYGRRTERPMLKYLNLLEIFKALERVEADVCHSQLNDVVALVSAIHARKEGRIYCLTMRAGDCIVGNYPWWKRPLLKLPPRMAGQNFVTYDHQVEEVRESYGVEAEVAPDPIELPDFVSSGGNVLFVNRLVEVKRPLLFVDLARRMRSVPFEMVGYGPLEGEVKRRRPPNLDFVGRLSPEETRKRYEEASVVVTTSTFEGVPCVWLEAWAAGVPVVSTVDRGGMLDRWEDLGRKSKGVVVGEEEMEGVVRAIVEDDRLRRRMGMNGRSYVMEKHDPGRIAEKHIKVYERLLSSE